MKFLFSLLLSAGSLCANGQIIDSTAYPLTLNVRQVDVAILANYIKQNPKLSDTTVYKACRLAVGSATLADSVTSLTLTGARWYAFLDRLQSEQSGGYYQYAQDLFLGKSQFAGMLPQLATIATGANGQQKAAAIKCRAAILARLAEQTANYTNAIFGGVGFLKQ